MKWGLLEHGLQADNYSIGGVDVSAGHLECLGVHHEIFSEDARLRLSHTPFKLIKRVDKATPLLYGAFDRNMTVHAIMKYFNNHPDTGETQHFFTVELSNARMSGVRQWMPNNLDPAGANFPLLEEISITYNTIRFTSETGSTEHQISVNGVN